MNSVPNMLGEEFYRNILSKQGKKIYDQILKQLLKRDFSGMLKLDLIDSSKAATDGFAAYKSIRDDHPEFFYLGYHCEFTTMGLKGILKYTILYSREIIDRVQYQLRKGIYGFVRGTAGLSVIDREKLVYERISKKLTYMNNYDARDHNVVGPILSDSGVCEGHNALLILCLRRIGIPCIKVYGKTEGDGWHCWTIAWLYGKPVHCDVTWENPDDHNGITWFNYFNLSDRQIRINHFSFQGEQIPRCVTEEYTFFNHYGCNVNSLSEFVKKIESNNVTGAYQLLHINYRKPRSDIMFESKKALNMVKSKSSYVIKVQEDLGNVLIINT